MTRTGFAPPMAPITSGWPRSRRRTTLTTSSASTRTSSRLCRGARVVQAGGSTSVAVTVRLTTGFTRRPSAAGDPGRSPHRRRDSPGRRRYRPCSRNRRVESRRAFAKDFRGLADVEYVRNPRSTFLALFRLDGSGAWTVEIGRASCRERV